MSDWTVLASKFMTNGWFWQIIIILSFIVALRNVYASFKIEKDIQKGIDPKVAAKHHRRLFYRKKDVLEYQALFKDTTSAHADREAKDAEN